MMISPLGYEDLHNADTYEDLIKERNYLVRKIKQFEKNKDELMKNVQIYPSPEVVYQMNLEYLARICLLIQQKFNENEC